MQYEKAAKIIIDHVTVSYKCGIKWTILNSSQTFAYSSSEWNKKESQNSSSSKNKTESHPHQIPVVFTLAFYFSA